MGAAISVDAVPNGQGWECGVEVRDRGTASRHSVRLSPSDLERWGRPPSESPESLVARAFEFLLARESAVQILSRFDLEDIQLYFPEFDREMREP